MSHKWIIPRRPPPRRPLNPRRQRLPRSLRRPPRRRPLPKPRRLQHPKNNHCCLSSHDPLQLWCVSIYVVLDSCEISRRYVIWTSKQQDFSKISPEHQESTQSNFIHLLFYSIIVSLSGFYRECCRVHWRWGRKINFRISTSPDELCNARSVDGAYPRHSTVGVVAEHRSVNVFTNSLWTAEIKYY